jgi:hypothetical protein
MTIIDQPNKEERYFITIGVRPHTKRQLQKLAEYLNIKYSMKFKNSWNGFLTHVIETYPKICDKNIELQKELKEKENYITELKKALHSLGYTIENDQEMEEMEDEDITDEEDMEEDKEFLENDEN